MAESTDSKQKTLAAFCVQLQILSLSKMVEKLGGANLVESLDRQIQAIGRRQNPYFEISKGRVKHLSADRSWTEYRELLQAAVDFAVHICGRAKIKHLFAKTTLLLEKRTRHRFQETVQRLQIRF
ncbi:MAG: hypothetical protein AAF402_02185 [Pseudomonadota bacterium]